MVSASRSLVLAAVAGSAMAQLTVNTVSSLITCQPALLSWSGGSGESHISTACPRASALFAKRDFQLGIVTAHN